mmetsp:Transcript_22107/g.26983  ORF Transcript_22107/g.26983 Transcript_22107/m.26983 type:complete len:336 (+) Transcript_22107:154-1161(+)
MKLNICLQSLLILALALVIGNVLRYQIQPQLFHKGEKWERLLEMYDDIASEQFRDCDSRLLPLTEFGATYTHSCGDKTKPPVLFFHGMGTNSLMYGDWLIPSLSKDYYAVAVDTLCDMGRSLPLNGNPSSCPQTEQEIGEWAKEVLNQLGIQKPVSLVGYSYGCFVSSCVARAYPDIVDKMVMIAPAAVFAPIEWSWLWRAIVAGLLGDRGMEYFFTYMFVDPKDAKKIGVSPLQKASYAAGSPQMAVNPVAFSVETLQDMTRHNPIILIIGKQETVINSTLAVDTAIQAGVEVKLYPDSGHMLFVEHPRESVVHVVASFLGDSLTDMDTPNINE